MSLELIVVVVKASLKVGATSTMLMMPVMPVQPREHNSTMFSATTKPWRSSPRTISTNALSDQTFVQTENVLTLTLAINVYVRRDTRRTPRVFALTETSVEKECAREVGVSTHKEDLTAYAQLGSILVQQDQSVLIIMSVNRMECVLMVNV